MPARGWGPQPFRADRCRRREHRRSALLCRANGPPRPVPDAVPGRPATTTSAEMNTAMRFGPAPAGPIDVLTALPEQERIRSPADEGSIPPAVGLVLRIRPVHAVGAGTWRPTSSQQRRPGRPRIGRSATSRVTTPHRHARLPGRSGATRSARQRTTASTTGPLTWDNGTMADGGQPLHVTGGQEASVPPVQPQLVHIQLEVGERVREHRLDSQAGWDPRSPCSSPAS